jgi:hypothetical protein
MTKVTSITGAFAVDSIRSIVNALLREATAGRFLYGATSSGGKIVGASTFYFDTVVGPENSYNSATEVPYEKVGSQLSFTGVPTENLPFNRKNWSDFGQFCEDMTMGRLGGDFTNAEFVILDQLQQKIYVYESLSAMNNEDVSGGLEVSAVYLEGTKSFESEDFFEG